MLSGSVSVSIFLFSLSLNIFYFLFLLSLKSVFVFFVSLLSLNKNTTTVYSLGLRGHNEIPKQIADRRVLCQSQWTLLRGNVNVCKVGFAVSNLTIILIITIYNAAARYLIRNHLSQTFWSEQSRWVSDYSFVYL